MANSILDSSSVEQQILSQSKRVYYNLMAEEVMYELWGLLSVRRWYWGLYKDLHRLCIFTGTPPAKLRQSPVQEDL